MPNKRDPNSFVFLPIEAFRKLTPTQKQDYLKALHNHLDAVTDECTDEALRADLAAAHTPRPSGVHE